MEGMEDVLLPPAGGGRCWVSITPPRTGLLNTIGGSTAGGGALLIARITGALITLFSNSFFLPVTFNSKRGQNERFN